MLALRRSRRGILFSRTRNNQCDLIPSLPTSCISPICFRHSGETRSVGNKECVTMILRTFGKMARLCDARDRCGLRRKIEAKEVRLFDLLASDPCMTKLGSRPPAISFFPPTVDHFRHQQLADCVSVHFVLWLRWLRCPHSFVLVFHNGLSPRPSLQIKIERLRLDLDIVVSIGAD